jgi:hypothetical protein
MLAFFQPETIPFLAREETTEDGTVIIYNYAF